MQDISIEVLEILVYLHSLNPPVLHRDIKPSNLIWGENEQIYLVDFGAVQNQAAIEGVTFTVVGTSGYAPLEQFWGRVVPASDLYALGATLIHLLTVTAPADLPQRNLRIQFADHISLNPSFVRWVEALTEPDLEQRYETAFLALEDLKAGRSERLGVQKNSQPVGSRLKLRQSPNQLLIEIPGRGMSLEEAIICIGIMFLLPLYFVVASPTLHAILGFIWILLGFILSLKTVTIVLILLFTCLCIAVSKALAELLDDLTEALITAFRHRRIYFDRNYFTLEWRLFGFCYHHQQAQVPEIIYIQDIPYKEVIIQTKMKKYSFGENLTESERQWLSQKIQAWLKFD